MIRGETFRGRAGLFTHKLFEVATEPLVSSPAEIVKS